ncbi:MAG TPA: hypothetical protein VMW65_14660 [Chloroflexota bacterium]|nr:hypothetical protein [Chloroflexota bacterium]
MRSSRLYLYRNVLFVVLAMRSTIGLALADDEVAAWKKDEAGRYLDERAQSWFGFASADRGEAETKSTCVSCHTLGPYVLARPALRKLTGTREPTDYEEKLLAQTRMRVERWQELDSPKLRLLYDSDEQKKKESWGTEAVLNAVILGFDDRYQGRSSPSDSTRLALAHLWKAQSREGDEQGSWDWLNFGLDPWEASEGRYFGAALAAIAVATAPGYYSPGSNTDLDQNMLLLRSYLKDHLARQNLFNQAWLLWASKGIDGLLAPDERKTVIRQLLAEQQADGGWRLASLGSFSRHDGTPQDTASDGYGTAFVLHVLQTVGVSKDDPEIALGLSWLRANQRPTGEWPASSVNKERDQTTHVGRFMSDAATAYAILALSH